MVVPEAFTEVNVEVEDGFDGPLFTGDGDVNYLCGRCGRVLAEGMENATQIAGTMRCPSCRAVNKTRAL